VASGSSFPSTMATACPARLRTYHLSGCTGEYSRCRMYGAVQQLCNAHMQ
jgi:hypothetical protein